MRRPLPLVLFLLAALVLPAPPSAGAEGARTMLFTSAPNNATVEATVQRPGSPKPLPASLVPALQRGDRIRITFPSSERGPGPAAHRFHALVAYIGLTTTFVPAKDPGYSLFPDRRKNDGREIDFTYDPDRGTPVVFLFPEDHQTRGVDGVRDYVLDHPAQFLGSAKVAATSDDRQVWLNSVVNQAPSNLSSVAVPVPIAPIITTAYDAAVGLLTGLWNTIRRPKQNYEFIPAALKYVAAEPGRPAHQEIAPLEPAKWDPPTGVSSALFFTIGRSDYDAKTDPQPAIVDGDAAHQPLCLLDERTESPLKLNRASAYVLGGTLSIYNAGSDQLVKSLPVSAAELIAPVLRRKDVPPGAYDVTLSAPLGFAELTAPQKVRVVHPVSQSWVTDTPLKIVAGAPQTTLDFTSPEAPCVTAAELIDGSLHAIAAQVTHPGPERLSLAFDTSKMTPGDATVRIHQGSTITDGVRYFSALPYPDVAAPVTVYDADAAIELHGQRLQLLSAVTLKSASGATLLRLQRERPAPPYETDGSTATFRAARGQIEARTQPAILQLSYSDGREANEVAVNVQPARPAIASVDVAATSSSSTMRPTQSAVLYSGENARITVVGPPGTIFPQKAELRLRKASLARTFGEGAPTVTLATVPQADGRTLQGTLDLSTQLGESLNERLQVQVYDPGRQVGSDWVSLDRRFVPSASIDQIDCSGLTDPKALCKMFGENLSRIEDVSDGTNASVPQPCPEATGTKSCVLVRDYAKYFVTMYGEAPAPTFALDDSLIKR